MARTPAPPLVASARDRALALSFAQQRLWFIEQLEPGRAAYNVSVCFRLSGPLDPGALRGALAEIVRRHEALRTGFVELLGQARQVIAPAGDVALELEIDSLEAVPEPERRAALDDRARREASRPFDLTAPPLLRATLLRLAERDHALVLVTHHIVCDNWSMGILVGELAAAYQALAAGQAPALPALPVQYADFATWQRRWLAGAALDRLIGYWRQQLAGAPALLDLPADRPRPAQRSGRGARLYPELPRELVAALVAFSRRESVTLYMTLLAAFDALLWRITGQRDVVVGSPIAGRNRRELEGLIGFFANTLVLRVPVDGEHSFRALVRQVRAVSLAAYAHQDLPFEQLVDALAPTRDLGRTPVVQVMFGLQNNPFPRVRLGESALQPLLLDAGTATFDLTVSLEERDGGLVGWIEYNADLFDAATIERLFGHYRVLLEAAVARPHDRLAALPLLAEPERRLLADWSRTAAQPPAAAPVTVVERFRDQARRTPDAIAVAAGGMELRYRELAARAEAWAAVLRARGCGRGARVALALSRGPAFPVAVLAVLQAGAAYVPLDPNYPAERFAFMLRDCEARVLVTEAALAARLPRGDAEVLVIDDAPEPPGALRDEPSPAPDDLAYVIYTSGSTGRPKGVAMPHRAVANLIAWQCARSPAGLRTLQFASPSFDVSFQELFATWGTGGCLVLATDDERRDPSELLRLCRDRRVERLFLPFVALHQLAEAAHGRDARDLALREVITAGEQLRITPAIAALFAQLPDCRLYNQYGPTETHLATEFPLTGAPATWDALPPIGRPIANVRVYVLDSELQPTPIGVPGELYIAGAGVASGYSGRPELTAERFVADPFVPGQTMYRTGDRARYLASGELAFLGRSDDQVKVRGFRVEPGEIEAALGSHPAVRQAAVIARVTAGDTRLIGYAACADGAVTAAELKRHLRAHLPDHMVPAVIALLPALPVTPNGKLDRRALPEPDAPDLEYLAPRTAMERAVAEVWTALLGTARIGATDNFFEAGGHSLLATQAVSRLRVALGVDLPVRALFEAPTVAELAARLEAATASSAELPIERVRRGAPLALSFAQQRLWFLAQLEPDGFTYNVPLAVRLTGALDARALEAGLQQVVARHDILRTRFVAIDGEPRQVIADELAVTLDVEPVAEADIVERARQEARQPFDLAAGPLIRARLLRLGESDHVLLIVMHHIVCDGWSIPILMRELAAGYRAARTGAPPLPALDLGYADFAAWQAQSLTGDRRAAQLAYWTEQLAGAPPALDLPTDRPRPAVRTTRGATVTRVLGGELAPAVRALSRREGATEFMTLLAAFVALLARITGQDDIVVGSPIAGRTRPEVEELIGFFVNTLVLRVDTGAPSFHALVQRVREVCLGAYAHQDLPFEQLVDALHPDREPDKTPLFQVVFAPYGASPAALDLPGVAASPLNIHPGMAKFDLTVFVDPGPDQIATTWEYNTDLFERATIERIAAHYEALLAQLTRAPEQRPSAASLVSAAERDHLLALGAAPADYPEHAALHALFEAQVARAPDAPAVVFGDARLSYAELNARANRLARCLAARGVGREDRVGVCLGRSLDFVVAVVAVIKAGACYVPLDPGYPAERLAFMADDTGARLTLTPAWLADAAAELAQLSDADPPVIATGRDLAYVMYTSGSTGRPKGTCIEQRSIARLVLGTDYVQLGRRDVVAHASNTSFDAATFEIWGALLNGATLHGIAPDVVLSPEALARELAAGGVTTLFITTALFHQIAAGAPGMFHALDHLLFGGEVVDPSAVRRVLAAGPPRRLLHVYGPTEATTFATWHLVREADAQAAVPIGRPIANTTVRIVDRHGQLAPIGVRGELCVGGPGVARGYWNRPELTAERFIADPFEPGGRLYRTGDIAAWRSDGAIEFFGRADHQVKLRGFRIELGEVEARLLEGGELAEAVAVVRSDAGEQRLVAYVVPRAGATADTDAIRARLTAALPRYMLPGAIVALDRLPVTPNGKLDRRALPAPSSRRAELGGGYLAPDGAREQAIAQIWAEVLRVDRVGANDNFFDLGGSSLLAVRLVALIARRLDVQLALKTFVEAPTVAALAARLAAPASPADPTDGCLVRLQAGARTPPIFFVHGGGGHALVYRELARAIDPERAMYGFSARGLDGDEPLHASIEDMASHYLELARRVQPEGPYLLVGASLGGVIAYEMARRLAASGHAVPLCAMLDSPGPGANPDEDVDPADLLRFHLGAHAWLDPAPLRGLPLDDQLRRVIEAARTAGAVLPFTELAHGRRLIAVWHNSLRVLRRYTAPPWPGGEVQFYSAAEPYQGSPGHLERAWIGRCAVRVEVVPGDHMSMVVPPHAASLGARIRAYLTRTGSLS